MKIPTDTYSLLRAADATGYDRKQLKRAASELGLQFQKHARCTFITETQLKSLVEHLGRPFRYVSRKGIPTHRWSNKHHQCRRCKRTGNSPGRRHAGKGYCESCHTVIRRNPKARRYKNRRKD